MGCITRGEWGRGPHVGRRGFSWGGVMLLLAILGIFYFGYTLSNSEKRQQDRAIRAVMDDPKIMLERFFVLRSRDYRYRDRGWRDLMEFMSRDDREWFDQNLMRLAAMSRELEGMMALAAKEGERRYAATKRLLGFGLAAPRLVVSTIELRQPTRYAVAYVHVPNRIETLTEVFLINEDGEWKIRRFMGERNNPTIIGALADDKRSSDEPLDADEQMYLDDPHTYHERRLVQLYEESGIAPPVRD